MIQGICGRTYFDCPEPSGPLSSWESKLRKRLATVGSTECALVWKEKTTPAGRSIFRLSRSTVLTNGTGSTGSPWTTPCASETGSRAQKYAQGGTSLNTQMVNVKQQASPRVTPAARDWKDSAGMATDRPDGRSRIDQLPRQMSAATWPTPTLHGNFSASGGQKGCSPTAGDGICTVMVATAVGGQEPTGSPATTTKSAGSPTPAHPCWLMGYGAEFLYLAPQNSARPRTRKKCAGSAA